jgi:hypothetical protein
MYVINKYEYPLFIKDIEGVDAKISKHCSLMNFHKQEDAIEWAKLRAEVIRRILAANYKDRKFNVAVENNNIVKLFFEEDSINYIIIKYEIVAN